MQQPISFAAFGLAVADQIFYAKDGTTYAQIKAAVPGLPEEGDLKEVDDTSILDESLDQMAASGLFREDPAGINGMYVERSLGGGLNALTFLAPYVRENELYPLGGFFALGSPDGQTYDAAGQYIIETAQAAEVDMSGCVPLEGGTPRTIAVVRKTETGDSERSFITSPGVANIATARDYIAATQNYQIQAATF